MRCITRILLVAMVASLAAKADTALIDIKRPGFAIRLERKRN